MLLLDDVRSRIAPLLLLSLTACGPSVDPGEGVGALRLNLARAPRVELALGTRELAADAALTIERWKLDLGVEGVTRPLQERGDSDLPRVVAARFDDPGADALLAPLGLSLADDVLTGKRDSFPVAELVLVAVFADPDRRGQPITLLLGDEERALAPFLRELRPGWRPELHVFQGGEPVAAFQLAANGTRGARLAMASRGRFRRDSDWYSRVEDAPPSCRVFAARELSPERVNEYVEALSKTCVLLAEWAPLRSLEQPITVVLEGHADALAQDLPRDAGGQFDARTGTVTVLLRDGLGHDGGQAVARALLLSTLGPPSEAWMLDGAAVDAAGVWWGRELSKWIAHLTLGEVNYPVAYVVDPRSDGFLTPHILHPMRGLFFRCLREETHGASFLLRMWEQGLDEKTLFENVSRFEALRSRSTVGARASVLSDHRLALQAARRPEPVWGAAWTSSVETAAATFGTRESKESLDGLAALGGRAVSITSLFPSRPGPSTGGALARPFRPGALEGDLTIALAMAEARSRDFYVMLQPHLVSTPAGSFTGFLKRTTTADWTQFFIEYEAFLVHYALLGDLLGCDLLCVGTDLKTAAHTTQTPEGLAAEAELDEERRSVAEKRREQLAKGWTRLIRRARQTFGGALTYAVASVYEADLVGFWKQVDYLGYELNHSLADAEGSVPLSGPALQSALLARFNDIGARAEALGQPLVITCVGFRSADRGFVRHEEAGGTHPDMALQARLFEGVASALAALPRGLRFPRRLFLWRWSAEAAQGGSEDMGYALNWKPAVAVARRIFGLP